MSKPTRTVPDYEARKKASIRGAAIDILEQAEVLKAGIHASRITKVVITHVGLDGSEQEYEIDCKLEQSS